MTFSDRLKELREEKKLSQREIAKIFHISQPSVYKWESEGVIPRQDILMEMCNFFDCTLDYLFGRTDMRNEEQKKYNATVIGRGGQKQVIELDEEDILFLKSLRKAVDKK